MITNEMFFASFMNSRVKYLDLSNITSDSKEEVSSFQLSLEYLLKNIQFNKSIISLNLRKNQIGDDGCIYIEKFLKNNDVIEELNVSENNIQFSGY
jgi:hypothetical protein